MAKKVTTKKTTTTKNSAAKSKKKKNPAASAKANSAAMSVGTMRFGGIDAELNVNALLIQSIDANGAVAVVVGGDFRKDMRLRVTGNCSPDNGTTVTVRIPGAVPNPATSLPSVNGVWTVEFPNVTGVADNVNLRAGAKNSALHGINEAVLFRKLTAGA